MSKKLTFDDSARQAIAAGVSKLARAVKEKGLTIVATRLFIADNGYAKLNIALARGKHEYDKRETIKEKDLKRYETD